MVQILQSLGGIVAITLIAWSLCDDRRAMPLKRALRVAGAGLAVQVAIAGAFAIVPQLKPIFDVLAAGVLALQEATMAGVSLVLGHLAGGPTPYEVTRPENSFILGLHALPLILVMSVLSRLLYYWGILQRVVAAFAWALRRTMGVGGALGCGTAANVLLGMVEAPLLVRPYLKEMDRGVLFALMTAGMATVAGTVLVVYATILEPVLPGAAGHLLVASVMSAPAALMIARLMVPWAEGADKAGGAISEEGIASHSTMDAIAKGTADGVRLLVYVAATLIVIVALIALLNMVLGLATAPFGLKLTVEGLIGWLAAPFAFAIGIPWHEAPVAGELIGLKIALNEFVAYLRLAEISDAALSPRSRLILTYAMCGFANFGSLGIMTGGLVAMCPERRRDILALGPKTIVSGMLSTLLTGAVVGVLTLG